MYAVSEQYKAAMKQPVQRFRMTGTIGDHPSSPISAREMMRSRSDRSMSENWM